MPKHRCSTTSRLRSLHCGNWEQYLWPSLGKVREFAQHGRGVALEAIATALAKRRAGAFGLPGLKASVSKICRDQRVFLEEFVCYCRRGIRSQCESMSPQFSHIPSGATLATSTEEVRNRGMRHQCLEGVDLVSYRPEFFEDFLLWRFRRPPLPITPSHHYHGTNWLKDLRAAQATSQNLRSNPGLIGLLRLTQARGPSVSNQH